MTGSSGFDGLTHEPYFLRQPARRREFRWLAVATEAAARVASVGVDQAERRRFDRLRRLAVSAWLPALMQSMQMKMPGRRIKTELIAKSETPLS
jgi:hypothetical protein